MKEETQDVQMNMSLYDLNKSVVFSLPPQDEKAINKHLEEIESWFYKYEEPWFMLMCKERSDFTLIHIVDDYTQATHELREVLEGRGTICNMQYLEDEDSWEIWVKNDEEAFMFMFFEAAWLLIEV